MKSLTPEYVVGLVDGEGSFTVYIRNMDATAPTKRRVVVEPKFYIKLVDTDKIILDQVQQFFGCGSVYFQKDTRPNHKHCYRYEVYKREDLVKKIIPFFTKHPLHFPSKAKDFSIFCRLMEMIEQGVHSSEAGVRNMFAIKQTMH